MLSITLAAGAVLPALFVGSSFRRWIPEAPQTVVWAAAVIATAFGGWLTVRLQHSWGWPDAVGPVMQMVFALWIVLAIIDAITYRLPNALVAWSVGLPVAALPFAALVVGEQQRAVRIILAGLVAGAAYLLLHLISPGGMGFGDVKFAPSIGLLMGWHSWGAWLWATAAAFLLSAAWALALIWRRTPADRRVFAFGPYMVAGAVTVSVVSSGIIEPCCAG